MNLPPSPLPQCTRLLIIWLILQIVVTVSLLVPCASADTTESAICLGWLSLHYLHVVSPYIAKQVQLPVQLWFVGSDSYYLGSLQVSLA